MTSRRLLVLTVAAALAAGCSGRYGRSSRAPAPANVGAGGSGSDGAAAPSTLAERGEHVLAELPWHPDVLRANLGAHAPVALTQIYPMQEDLLAVDTAGKVFCLSRRDLTPRWISSLKAPLAAPPAESPLHFVFLEKDAMGAAWLQWFSRRSGAEAGGSPVRLPYSPSSGVGASASTAYVGSLGSPIDNKLLETINLADGSPGWGYRPHGRVVATPTLDPSGEILLVLSEDQSVASLPANQAASTPAQVNWVRETTGANTSAPAVTKDWAFVASEDNFLRAYDVHSGNVLWLRGTDAPIHRSPWLLGRSVVANVPTGGEGSPTAKVERYQGYVFVKNELGLHAFDAATGEEVFRDPAAERPLVIHGDWVITLGHGQQAQLRKGKGLPVVMTAGLGGFDFLPTNSQDGTVIAGFSDGTILLAVPK